ncbi:MAG TPA: hypothetical protein VFK69_13230 [Candidatus Eisenbacteria bacterium]|nr:hypothetical protein [Candidatus Eisenbacteria bacterium]
MKLVSDFDGVWTDPSAEASAQGEELEQALLGWTDEADRAHAAEWLVMAREHVRREPDRYGWAPGGRLSAFGDEDPFAAHSALLHYLHLAAGRDPVARRLHGSILANGFRSLEAFGGHTHRRGVAKVVAARGPALLPDAAAAGRAMLARGTAVTVVSNSGADKLAHWFGSAGVPASVHPDERPGAARLRGGARKFVLDPDRSEFLEVGELRIEVARPNYERILREELPDAIVGDVFSLDLALPLALRRRDPAFARVGLYWLIQGYTPTRIRDEVAIAAPEVMTITGGLKELAERIRA